MIEGNEELQPGTIVEGDVYENSGNERKGILLHHDLSDNSVLIINPMGDGSEWDLTWLTFGTLIDISTTPEGRELRERFPIDPLSPKYIFMVIRPPRRIETFANLDALLAADVEMAYPSTGKLPLKQAAAEAIADPETDIKLHPNRNVFLRFTQVEGA